MISSDIDFASSFSVIQLLFHLSSWCTIHFITTGSLKEPCSSQAIKFNIVSQVAVSRWSGGRVDGKYAKSISTVSIWRFELSIFAGDSKHRVKGGVSESYKAFWIISVCNKKWHRTFLICHPMAQSQDPLKRRRDVLYILFRWSMDWLEDWSITRQRRGGR